MGTPSFELKTKKINVRSLQGGGAWARGQPKWGTPRACWPAEAAQSCAGTGPTEAAPGPTASILEATPATT
ncbi:hypothetical protein COCSUDRAFT_58239 [Coccomyxa subellipsoidea C-169]|uniref:Uncharacterized protein n=1 Tax=Coccomyxa subellipsoidea (strain C-169) TaxID=574566 RepID=I0YNN7_COCSC|nr:hypothetical protein COCSUDRAFT_58239 [Coccomyxa subellipsoidea C-169]EIE20006.1 hypothetical protein COCSUDRAFT_58239 [Coccomyxa subellipsoidea C-169]|eukprot:XP_005644550.1 hypothetical protein COCSUDRAFT_58239 [Coccomyxa subellipsoidea C-169]